MMLTHLDTTIEGRWQTPPSSADLHAGGSFDVKSQARPASKMPVIKTEPLGERRAPMLSASWNCASWPYAVGMNSPIADQQKEEQPAEQPLDPMDTTSAVPRAADNSVASQRSRRSTARRPNYSHGHSDSSSDEGSDRQSYHISNSRTTGRRVTHKARSARSAASSGMLPEQAENSPFHSQADFNSWVRNTFLVLKKRMKATGLSLHVRSLKYSTRQYTLVSRFSRAQKGFRRYYHLANVKCEAQANMEAHVREMKALRTSWLQSNMDGDGGSADEQMSDDVSPLDSPISQRGTTRLSPQHSDAPPARRSRYGTRATSVQNCGPRSYANDSDAEG